MWGDHMVRNKSFSSSGICIWVRFDKGKQRGERRGGNEEREGEKKGGRECSGRKEWELLYI